MPIYRRRSLLVALALSCALTLAPAPPLAAAVDSTAISRIVASFHAEERFNGAVLVAAGDEVVFEGGFGEADRVWHVPNRPDTVFLVGSVSKQFTSMLVLQLVSEGKLSLDDTLGAGRSRQLRLESGEPGDRSDRQVPDRGGALAPQLHGDGSGVADRSRW